MPSHRPDGTKYNRNNYVYDQQQALFISSGTVPVAYCPAQVPFNAKTEAEFLLKFCLR
jgi:hypothetical protein